MSMWSSALAVQVETHGARQTFGPFPGLPSAMQFVSEYLGDTDRYRHEYVRLTDPAAPGPLLLNDGHTGGEGVGLFDLPPREHREPLEAVLRAAIEREHGAPGDGPHGDGLYSHLDVHRPWRVEMKAEACWDGECDHLKTGDGSCAARGRCELWCRGCTPVYIGGGEWDGNPYDECEVDWPCSPVLAMCESFDVSLTGKALHAVRPPEVVHRERQPNRSSPEPGRTAPFRGPHMS